MKKQERRYTPFVQQPYCCVPACLQMVLYRRGIPLLSQEEIGHELGLTVPKEYQKILPLARKGKKPSSGWGTQIQNPKYTLNNFFKKRNIPLKETYYPTLSKTKARTFIRVQIKKGNDILVCFNYNKLYQDEGQGHVSVIEALNGDYITIVEPISRFPKFRKVEFDKLIESINFHGEKNRGGFWVISKRGNK